MADDFGNDNLNRIHGNGSVELTTSPRRYEGVMVPRRDGQIIPLKQAEAARLCLIEAKNRLRVKPGGIKEKVDFIAVCIKQEWKCCICNQLMTPRPKGSEPNAISVEHNPALSVCNEHSARTVYAAHRHCNIEKGHKSDTTRAAKIKRVDKDEERHARQMRMKITMTPAAIRREKLKEKIAAGNKAIRSRNTFDRPSLLFKLERSESPSKWGRAGGKKSWPKGRGFQKVYSKTTGEKS